MDCFYRSISPLHVFHAAIRFFFSKICLITILLCSNILQLTILYRIWPWSSFRAFCHYSFYPINTLNIRILRALTNYLDFILLFSSPSWSFKSQLNCYFHLNYCSTCLSPAQDYELLEDESFLLQLCVPLQHQCSYIHMLDLYRCLVSEHMLLEKPTLTSLCLKIVHLPKLLIGWDKMIGEKIFMKFWISI